MALSLSSLTARGALEPLTSLEPLSSLEPLETLEPLADGAGGAQVYAHVRARFAAHAAACGV